MTDTKVPPADNPDGPAAADAGPQPPSLPLVLEHEENTPEDLAAQANVGFALDLDDTPLPPAPAADPTPALAFTPVVPLPADSPSPAPAARAEPMPSPPSEPGAGAPSEEPYVPGALSLEAPEPDTEEDRAARANVGFALDLDDLPPADVGASPVVEPAAFAPVAPVPNAPAWGAPPAASATLLTSSPPLPTAPAARAPAAMPRGAATLSAGHRQYPLAWAWAGLGSAPVLGRHARPGSASAAARMTSPEGGAGGLAAADEVLELAAVGKGTDGITEMLLVFKDEVWAGVTCKLRMEPGGIMAVFVAPDDGTRRAVDGMADEMLARMRRRGLKVGGYTVEVSG